MISLSDYVGSHALSKDWTPERQTNAATLLKSVNNLMSEMEAEGIEFDINPKTKTQVSGETYGGFRPQSCPIGAPKSNHKQGRAVDIYDVRGEIDAWCLENQDRLKEHGIWLEHPSATPHWSHWQSVSPNSGNRVFYP